MLAAQAELKLSFQRQPEPEDTAGIRVRIRVRFQGMRAGAMARRFARPIIDGELFTPLSEQTHRIALRGKEKPAWPATGIGPVDLAHLADLFVIRVAQTENARPDLGLLAAVEICLQIVARRKREPGPTLEPS